MIAPQRGVPVRVTRQHPCPVCGRPKYCVLLHGARLVLCTRVEVGSKRPSRDGSGWLHVLQDNPTTTRGTRTVTLDPPPPDLRPIVEDAAVTTPAAWLASLAESLGLRSSSGAAALRRLGAHRPRYAVDALLLLSPRDEQQALDLRRQCAWLARADAIAAFPMQRRGRIVGVRLRDARTGRKLALRGGREGAFVPDGVVPGEPTWIVEGPTDCAAVLSIGLPSIGRPSATGHDAVVELVRAVRPAAVVVVADRDGDHNARVGQRTADDLAVRLALLVPDVRTILPPGGAKDARAAVIAGAGRPDFEAAAAAAECYRIPAPRRLP